MTTTTACFNRSGLRRAQSRRGFSLVELMVGSALAAMLMAAVMSSFVFILKSSYGIGNYVDLNINSRIAVEQFGRDVRMAERVLSKSETAVEMRVKDLGTVRYLRSGNTLVRELWVLGSLVESRVILEDVEGIKLMYFNSLQRDDSGDDPPKDRANFPSEVKMIQLEAKLVRRVIRLENTNHLISARFTMRNNGLQ